MRRWIQLIFLGLFIYLIAITKWPPSDAVLVDAFLTIDPLLLLQAIIASGTWIGAAFYGIVILILTFILGRFFCGYLCPMGACLEFGDEIFIDKGKRRHWKNRVRKYRGVKYAILLIILVAAFFGHGLAYLFDPICWLTRILVYGVWPIFVAGQNIFLDIFRPLFESIGWMNLARKSLSQPALGTFGILSIIFFITIIWFGRYQKRFWCRVLCPLGALFAIPARFSLMKRIVGKECDENGVCSKVCQMGAIGDKFKKYDPQECIVCQKCVSGCTATVTRFGFRNVEKVKEPSFDLERRKVIGTLGIGIIGASWLSLNPKTILIDDEGIRPPGALIENKFLATCVRCGQCVKVCPTNCLQPSALTTGIAGFMTPIAIMRLGACDQNCNACGTVCPTDAIRELDLDEKTYAKIGNAVIDQSRCIVWEQNRVCLVCDEHCPYGAIYWKEIEKGNRLPFVDENRCNGCGQCERSCPIQGSSAIRIFTAGQIRLNHGSYNNEADQRGLILEEKEDEFYFMERSDET